MAVKESEVSVIRGCGASVASLQAAFAATTGAYIYVIDGDIAGNEAKLDRFMRRMDETGADIVVGTKRSRRWKNRLYFAFVRVSSDCRSPTRRRVRGFIAARRSSTRSTVRSRKPVRLTLNCSRLRRDAAQRSLKSTFPNS